MTARERLDELQWLLGRGVWPPTACARLGWSIGAAEKAARADGRRDMAAVLWRHIKAARAAA